MKISEFQLSDGVEVRRRWAKYFEQVQNVPANIGVPTSYILYLPTSASANMNVVGNLRTPMLGDLNGSAISLVEVREAVNEMKSGKAPGLDGFPVECLKKGGTAVLEWLVRQLDVNFDMGVVPMDWHGACIVPLYKGKGDKCECSNSRGISLLSVLGKPD